MTCGKCGSDSPEHAKFCHECGAVLTACCRGCGTKLLPAAKFCLECGVPVAEREDASPDTVSAFRTPAAPPDSDVARPGERRQLTVLFCDLVGSTSLAHDLDAEDWRDVLARYHAAAAGAVARWGGHVAKNLGDGVLVYFGWPTAREDDPERAVRAGLAILDALGPLNEGLALGGGTRLAVRIGMHTGPVVIADGGEVFGDTANVAARVQSAAPVDTVAITAATQRLVAGMFVVEDRGPQALAGVREPVVLYRVVQPSGVRSRLDVAAGRLTRYVGREVELATLVERWERAQDGEGQNVVVLGEAGVGKSRLVYQLHERLADVPHTWLECGATPYTAGTPFHPIIALVAQGLGFAAEDTTADKLGKVERGLRALASAETVALLAEFLGLPPPTPLPMSSELQRRKTLDLLAQWNLATSEVQPLVMLVEDLHWCDTSTVELLGRLVAQSPTARVLLLATARPDFTPPWPARSNLTTVQLARLTKRQARDMVAALAGTDVPAATLDALVARADGVPLYLEELTKSVVEPGTTRGVETIPATLVDSLMGRLDRLSTAKEVAQRAAVLGREFAYPLLAAVAGLEEPALRHGLARLVEAEIVFARGEPPDATYTFKHALLQEAAYGSLLKRTRQQLHVRTAEALESPFPERVAAEPEVVARHYEQAGLAAQAIAHYRRAGEQAAQRSANEEAIGHLRRALDLLATLPETRERHQQELGLQVALGAPLVGARSWSHPEHEQVFVRARELASRIGASPELPRVLLGVADVYLVRGELTIALEAAREALAAAERTGKAFDLLSAHEQVGVSFLFGRDLPRALEHFEKSVELYDPATHGSLAYAIGFDRGLYSHAFAAWCHALMGRPDRALASSEASLALARRLGHELSLAHALFCAAAVHFERRTLDRTRECAEEIVVIAEKLGFPAYLGFGMVFEAWTRVEAGDVVAGIEEIQQALLDLARIGGAVTVPVALVIHADGLARAGRREEALDALVRGGARFEQQGQRFYDAELRRLRAEILLDVDGSAVEEAEALLGQSLEIARRQAAKTLELRAATSLARLWQRQGKRAAARAMVAPIYTWFTEGFGTRDLIDAKALLEELR